MRWRRSVPDDVRSRLALERGERVLVAERDARDRWWIGTHQALHFPAEAGSGGHDAGTACRRLPWERIEHVEWDRDAEILRITETAPLGEPLPTVVVHLPEPGWLLGLIRERVQASIVVSRHVPLYGARGVRVVARRPPGSDVLSWSVVFDDTLDPSDPDTLAAAERALAELRTQVEP